ncbi:hypothetical protein Droror1_Dr00023905 [Drosera rotundifolia]
MMFYDSLAAWLNSFLACMGGCLGTCGKPIDKLSYMVDKSGISEDFWTTSAYDILDATPSQKSMSWMSASNQNSLCNPASGNANNEFVNHGLLQWNQSRGQWTDCARHQPQCRRHEGLISSSATYDNLLAIRQRFHHPIPLAEMVCFLVDVWEKEGLYD